MQQWQRHVMAITALFLLLPLYRFSITQGEAMEESALLVLVTAAPAASPTSLRPTIITTTNAPTTPLTLEQKACLALVIESKRPQTLPVRGTCDTKEQVPMEEFQVLPQLFANNGTVFLTGDDWGQLCNKLGILSGALLRAEMEQQNVLALDPTWSEVLWYLDLHAVSNAMKFSRGGGILLDCIACTSNEAVRGEIRCKSLLLPGGRLFALDNTRQFFAVNQVYDIGHMYYSYRPRNRGYSKFLVENLLPNPFLFREVERQMRAMKTAGGSSLLLFGVHRRTMDRQCLRYATRRTEYNCLVHDTVYGQVNEIEADVNSGRFTLLELERRHPMVMACNYTLQSEDQIREIILPFLPQDQHHNTTTTTAARIDVFLATDGIDLQGDLALAQAPIVSNLHRLDSACFAGVKYQAMLADMLALSQTDIHVGNPLSSCGNIVAHWRHKLYAASNYSSFPRLCYDFFYREEINPMKKRG